MRIFLEKACIRVSKEAAKDAEKYRGGLLNSPRYFRKVKGNVSFSENGRRNPQSNGWGFKLKRNPFQCGRPIQINIFPMLEKAV